MFSLFALVPWAPEASKISFCLMGTGFPVSECLSPLSCPSPEHPLMGCWDAALLPRPTCAEGRVEGRRRAGNISGSVMGFYTFGLWLSASPVVTVTDNMTENEEIFKEKIHELLHTAERDWFVNPKDIWTFFGSLFFCCTVFTTVGKSGGKETAQNQMPHCSLWSISSTGN